MFHPPGSELSTTPLRNSQKRTRLSIPSAVRFNPRIAVFGSMSMSFPSAWTSACRAS